MIKNAIRKIKDFSSLHKNLLEILLPFIIIIVLAYFLSPEFKNISNLILNTSYSTYSIQNPSIYTSYFQISIISGSALLGLIPIFLVGALGKIQDNKKLESYVGTIFGFIVVALFLLVFFAVAESFSGFISYAKFTSYINTNTSGVHVGISGVSLSCSSNGYVSGTTFNTTCDSVISSYNQVVYAVEYSIGSLYYAFILLLYLLIDYVVIVTYKQKTVKKERQGKKDR
ncbi:MAG: hypothetical protein QXL94_05105 [Candidatus Parvarchaeum sp.]